MHDVQELEDIAFRAWPPAQVIDVDGWRLRLMDGVTRRGNSVWPNTTRGELLVEERIKAAEAEYSKLEQRCLFQVGPLAKPSGRTGTTRPLDDGEGGTGARGCKGLRDCASQVGGWGMAVMEAGRNRPALWRVGPGQLGSEREHRWWNDGELGTWSA